MLNKQGETERERRRREEERDGVIEGQKHRETEKDNASGNVDIGLHPDLSDASLSQCGNSLYFNRDIDGEFK